MVLKPQTCKVCQIDQNVNLHQIPAEGNFSQNFVSGYFLQLYAALITRYPLVTRKEAKKFIGDMENVPQFLKLSWTSHAPMPMLFTVTTFILTHVCENLKCGKLSLLVCDDCRVAHYCDEECQEADWGRHQNICEKMKNERLSKFLILNGLFVDMKKINKKVISFEVFFRVYLLTKSMRHCTILSDMSCWWWRLKRKWCCVFFWIFFGHFRGCQRESFLYFFSQKIQKHRKLVKKGEKL